MKKAICALAIAATLAATGMIYPDTTIVRDVNQEADTVTIETGTGNLFCFEGCSDWEIGDGCSVIFWSNGTNRVEDDAILVTRYTNLDLFRSEIRN